MSIANKRNPILHIVREACNRQNWWIIRKLSENDDEDDNTFDDDCYDRECRGPAAAFWATGSLQLLPKGLPPTPWENGNLSSRIYLQMEFADFWLFSTLLVTILGQLTFLGQLDLHLCICIHALNLQSCTHGFCDQDQNLMNWSASFSKGIAQRGGMSTSNRV